jgi:hypothetical protein
VSFIFDRQVIADDIRDVPAAMHRTCLATARTIGQRAFDCGDAIENQSMLSVRARTGL